MNSDEKPKDEEIVTESAIINMTDSNGISKEPEETDDIIRKKPRLINGITSTVALAVVGLLAGMMIATLIMHTYYNNKYLPMLDDDTAITLLSGYYSDVEMSLIRREIKNGNVNFQIDNAAINKTEHRVWDMEIDTENIPVTITAKFQLNYANKWTLVETEWKWDNKDDAINVYGGGDIVIDG